MSGNVEFVVGQRGMEARRGAYQITLAESHDWMRLWPREEAAGAGFRLATMPIRLVALGLLWATSTPGRLLFGVALAAAVALVIIIR